MLNQVVLVGRLVKDPELVEKDSNKKMSRITIAIPRSTRSLDDQVFLHCTGLKTIYLASSFSMRFERQGLLLDSMTEFQVFGYPKDYADTYVSELMKLTPADIKKSADRALDVDKMLLMIAGDAKVLEPQLREAGWKAQVLTVDEILQPYGKAEQ